MTVIIHVQHTQANELLEALLQERSLKDYLIALKNTQLEIYEHSLRVCRLCLDLGIENGLDQPYLNCLGKAGLLHDIGKTRLPRELLAKAESLDRHEFRLVRGHVRLGFIALADMQPEMVKEVVVAHHEFSSEPYPRNGVERRQRVRTSADRRSKKPMARKMAEIVAVVDIADALANERSYKKEYPKEKIEAILRTEFCGDPKLVDQVLTRIDEEDRKSG